MDALTYMHSLRLTMLHHTHDLQEYPFHYHKSSRFPSYGQGNMIHRKWLASDIRVDGREGLAWLAVISPS
jgi:hypothetical protein